MEALLYTKLENNKVKCRVCNHYCVISNHKRGICGVRENQDGVLIALNYEKYISYSVDPIEKKPLYHFMPRTKTYSFASVGCNMSCKWCQNSSISQSPKPDEFIQGIRMSAIEHIVTAKSFRVPSISYTYSEPTIFLEYALDVMKLARENGLKNIWVTNGYMSDETLDLILPYLDAVNVDYKGTNQTYKEYCLGDADSVLKNIRRMIDYGVHVEVTTLVIPGVNDSFKDIEKITDDIAYALGINTIWHISRFFPGYKMLKTEITPLETLKRVEKIGRQKGLKHIYLGNI